MRRTLLAVLFLLTSHYTLATNLCSPLSDYRQTIEEHFQLGQLSSMLSKQQAITIVLDNEYDEQTPRRRLKLSPPEARNWLDTLINSSETRLAPTPVRCQNNGCRYHVPELTLHHAIYLLGWQRQLNKKCSVILLHLMLG